VILQIISQRNGPGRAQPRPLGEQDLVFDRAEPTIEIVVLLTVFNLVRHLKVVMFRRVIGQLRARDRRRGPHVTPILHIVTH
jgi:hypothetical protein